MTISFRPSPSLSGHARVGLAGVLAAAMAILAKAEPPAPPAAAARANLLADVKLDAKSYRITQRVALPPEVRKVDFSAEIACEDFRPMPVPGYGVGVWILFENAQGEELNPEGKPGKGKRSEGFALGINRRTARPSLEHKTVAVPPGAEKIRVMITGYHRDGYGMVAPSRPVVTALTATVAP